MLKTFKQTIIVVSALLLGAAGVLAQTNSQNYVMSRTVRDLGITTNTQLSTASYNKDKVETTIQYLDGLGRPVQTVQRQGSAQGRDIVQPQTYDSYGREATKYLPYSVLPTDASDGSYKTNALTYGAGQAAFYTTPPTGVASIPNPFAATAFEPSPLNRITEQGAPGEPWQLTGTTVSAGIIPGHTVKADYGSNDQITAFNSTPSATNPGSRVVALYTASVNSDQSRTLTRINNNDTYTAGQLSLSITKNENWNPLIDGCNGVTETYTDKSGHVVLKRTYASTGANNTGTLQMLSTYYIYDDLGNLSFVLPPGALPDANAAISQTTLDNFCYQYQYDQRQRLSQKKIPGKGWEYMVYNNLDQLVASQDANQRTGNQWLFTKYDARGRVAMTGIWVTATNRADLQVAVNAVSALWETRQSGGNGYSNAAWPTANIATTLTLNYYDNYNNIPGLPSLYAAQPGASTMTNGLPTASQTNVLGSSDMLWSVNYYDDLGRVIQTYKQHYLGGSLKPANYDMVTTTYNFSNQATVVNRQHYNTAGLAVTIANTYNYDHMGRKTMTWEQINSGTNVLLSKVDYNEVGQAITKYLHSEDTGISFLQDIGYTYNERGWMRTAATSAGGTATSLFKLDLRYNTPDAGITQAFNGNISQMLYTVNNPAPATHQFSYGYDALNRLTSAVGTAGTLSEAITYDVIGNITGLTRGGQSYSALAYAYNGNQLTGVTGAGFTTRAYTYDGNGNATTNGAASNPKTINYNILNLPKSLTQSSSTIATYTYDAAGTKLRTNGTLGGTWDYIDGINYSSSTIAYIATEEGRVTNNGGTWKYEYNLKDQLGNVRVTIDKGTSGAAEVVQEDEYYAFGLRHSLVDNSNDNRYLYNGKEYQKDLTDQYDYGARLYDPVVARWTSVDPKAEMSRRFSPYDYVENNPIRNIDPDGMETYYGDVAASMFRAIKSQVSDQEEHQDKCCMTQQDNVKPANKANQGGCPTCVVPSTVGHNILGDNYTGGNNPMNYNETYNYSMPLMSQTDGPSLGHDRRYDRVGVAGPDAVRTDIRTSLIDLRFVAEQYSIVLNPANYGNPALDPARAISVGKSFIAGTGLLIWSLPKMINQTMTNPASWGSSLMWYQVSNIGVNNVPNK